MRDRMTHGRTHKDTIMSEPINVCITIRDGILTPSFATGPVVVVIIDHDGTQDGDHSDRIALDESHILSPEDFEQRVIAEIADRHEAKDAMQELIAMLRESRRRS